MKLAYRYGGDLIFFKETFVFLLLAFFTLACSGTIRSGRGNGVEYQVLQWKT